MFKSLNRGISAPIAIIIIVVCAALVGGIVVWQYYGMPKEEKKISETIKPPEEDPCKDLEKTEKDLCYYDVAKEKRDSAMCDKIQRQGYKEGCYEWVEFLLAYDEAEKKHIEYEIEPISEWETFKSSELGFEVKYPPDFTLKEENNITKFSFPEVNFHDTNLDLEKSGIFIIKRNKGYACSSFQEFEDWGYIKIITPNGDTFYQSNWPGAGCGLGYCELETSYYTIYNNYCYMIKLMITYSNRSSPDFSVAWGRVSFNKESLEETFSQMFSTFRFLEPTEDETADWKTYRNEEYGFEVECPSECEVNSSASLRKFGDDAIGYDLFKCEKGDKTMSINMAISPEFIFYMSGAGGYLHGETFFKKDIERGRTRSEEKTFNGVLFTEYYSIEYQGVGFWNRTINVVTKHPSRDYYVNFSIYLEDLGRLPDHFWIEPPYSFSEEGKEWIFQNIKEEENVKLFNQFLSTFKFID